MTPQPYPHPVDDLLHRTLYAFDCPPPEALANRVFGFLSPDAHRQVETHIKTCPRCQVEVAEMETFKAMTNLVEDDIPPSLQIVPKNIVAKPSNIYELFPDLPKAAGGDLRGAVAEARGLFRDGVLMIGFESDRIAVFLQLRRESGQQFLEGRVTDTDLSRWVDALVEVRQEERLQATAVVDANGGFLCVLPNGAPFALRITSLPGWALRIDHVE